METEKLVARPSRFDGAYRPRCAGARVGRSGPYNHCAKYATEGDEDAC